MAGILIIGANQIGNPEDIPSRSLKAVQTADVLVFEEDKPARQVLKAAGVHRDYLKYNEHKNQDTLDEVRENLLQGKTILYMSDQGIATIADPASALIKMAHEFGCKIVSIPGPCSVTAALQAWPKRLDQYTFVGFLPKAPAARRAAFERATKSEHPTVFMDTPYRLQAVMSDVKENLNANRDCLLAVDITGEAEEFIFAKAKNLPGLAVNIKKLNFVLVVDGQKKAAPSTKKPVNPNQKTKKRK